MLRASVLRPLASVSFWTLLELAGASTAHIPASGCLTVAKNSPGIHYDAFGNRMPAAGRRKRRYQSRRQDLAGGESEEDGVVTLESGLMYKVLRDGDGEAHPKASTSCECHYEGKLIDGTVFDSSYERGSPTSFAPNQVIKRSRTLHTAQSMHRLDGRGLLVEINQSSRLDGSHATHGRHTG